MRRVHALGSWSQFLAGCAITAALALGFGNGVGWLVASSQSPAPTLQTIPPGTLQRDGITLSAAPQPPYCGLADDGIVSHWLRTGLAGCAISQSAAEAAATRGASGTIQEAMLARVTANGGLPIGRNRLAWLVVLRGGFGPQRLTCPAGGAGPRAACATVPTPSFTRVVIVDGMTSQVVAVVIVGVQWASSAASTGWSRAMPFRQAALPSQS
jgi:hypothetical protein